MYYVGKKEHWEIVQKERQFVSKQYYFKRKIISQEKQFGMWSMWWLAEFYDDSN